MFDYWVTDDSILEVNGKQLNFKYKIKKVVKVSNTLIVLLDAEIKHWHEVGMFILPNNIYGVSYQGEVLWNVEVFFRPDDKHNGYHNVFSNKFVEMNPYNTYNYLYRRSLTIFTDIKRLADGNLAVYADVGMAYILDIEKKEVIGYFKSMLDCAGNIDYRIKDGTILQIAGKDLDFIFNIDNVVEVDNMLIVGIADNMSELRKVIYAISDEGKILWSEKYKGSGKSDKIQEDRKNVLKSFRKSS